MAPKVAFEPGRKLGRYELKERIAIGGMAEVWRAEATGIDGFHKSVVVKTILPQFSDDPEFVRMFTNEAKVAAALNHHNIVQIFDLGVIDETYYIAMESVHGKTLRRIQSALRRSARSVPPWFAFHVMMAVCDALDYAHSHLGEDQVPLGIIHRDISPENIMVSFSGVTKVLDFGIAKARLTTFLSETNSLKGKYPYMAPERIRSAHGATYEADRRSDIYSIGVVLFELAAGRLPFQDANDLALLQRILQEPPPPPRQLASWIPAELESIILRTLAKDPAARPQTAAALRDELSAFLLRSRSTTTTERHIGRFMVALFEKDEPSLGDLDEKRAESTHDSHTTNEGSIPDARDRHEPAPPAASPPSTPIVSQQIVLVVDPERVSRRFVELALSRSGFAVESANGAAAALEILQSTVVDLLICETDLPDMNGLQLLRRLQKESRLEAIPFVFLTSDTRIATKVLALLAGADDALPKPCDPLELAARVRSLIDRQRQRRAAQQQRTYVLAGDFDVLPLPDLVGMLEMSKRSGRLSVATDCALGEILFDQGRILHVVFGTVTGAKAFYRMMEESLGKFEFSVERIDRSTRTVTVSATELILEGARQIDTKRRYLTGRSEADGAGDAPRSQAPRSEGMIAGTSITPALAVQFELGIREGYSLGELRLLTVEEMAAWALSPGGRDRFHVHLVADVTEGVAAMLPLATPPGEREILSGLGVDAKLLGLDFFLRNERLLDVVLIDIRDLSAADTYLLRAPSLLVIAPPGGDIQSLGTTARVGLEVLLEHLRPPAILGLGTETLPSGLRELAYMSGPGLRTACVGGTLGDDRTDLRAVLVEGIRLWAGPEVSGGT